MANGGPKKKQGRSIYGLSSTEQTQRVSRKVSVNSNWDVRSGRQSPPTELPVVMPLEMRQAKVMKSIDGETLLKRIDEAVSPVPESDTKKLSLEKPLAKKRTLKQKQ